MLNELRLGFLGGALAALMTRPEHAAFNLKNGLEYEPSPDVILVPRFLGQAGSTSGYLIFVEIGRAHV